MYSSHVLLKFISEKKYVEDFLNGDLYMNSLYYFWDEQPVEDARKKKEAYLKVHPEVNPDDILFPIERKLSQAAADILEGTVGYGSNISFEQDFEEHLLSDIIYRAVGFQYCNILCFYKLDYVYGRANGKTSISYDIPSSAMKELGNYVLIVKDKKKLLKRINNAVKDMRFLCGSVQYESLRKDGKEVDISKRHHILLKSDLSVGKEDIQTKGYDCFSKMDKYEWQKEWRVALYRGEKDTKAFILHIGDIRDIAEYVRVKDLIAELDRMLVKKEIKRSPSGYYGNITREEMRDKFYQLGDNKTESFSFFG